MQQWIDEAWEKIVGKFTASSELAARMELIPYKSENGTWIASPFDGDSWWTNGFWPALMWQLYAGTEDERFLREARRVEKLLQKELVSFELLNHDVGFMYLLSSGADYKLTGSDEARRDTLHAATILAGRFNPTGFIRAWGQKGREGWAIVDCMMNLALLYWAHEQTGDPRFLKIARTHADTTMRCFVRPDGSCTTSSSSTRRRARCSTRRAARATARVPRGRAASPGRFTGSSSATCTRATRAIWIRPSAWRTTSSPTSARTD